MSVLRVLQVLAPAPVGGLESVVHALSRGLIGRGHDVHVAASVEQESHPFVVALRAAGVPVTTIISGARGYLHERAAITTLCRNLIPDAVHTHGYRSDVVAGGAARSIGVPTVSTAHGFVGSGWRARAYEWAQRMAWRRCDALVAVSRPLAARLATSIPREKVVLIPNAFLPRAEPLPRAEARLRLGVTDERPLVGWVGRLSVEKGCDVFVDALARLASHEITAVVIGDGPERHALEVRAMTLGIANSVRWTGSLAEASRLFTAFDAFVLSSRSEGMPIVLFEAMNARVPVVASRVGGVPDVVSDECAWLVAPERPEALADAIAAALADRVTGAQRTARAYDRLIDSFGSEPWLDKHVALYEQVAAGRLAPLAV
jgi:glycosyltransferase involved in cell wall biosynthesis